MKSKGLSGMAQHRTLEEAALRIRLIHPVAGVVAEFSSAYAMMDYLMRKGRQSLPEAEAELKELVFQISEGGLTFQEVVDRPTAATERAPDGILRVRSNYLVH
jgi:hypothetical protein